MEKVRSWCGQPSDRGQLKNRTEHDHLFTGFPMGGLFVSASANAPIPYNGRHGEGWGDVQPVLLLRDSVPVSDANLLSADNYGRLKVAASLTGSSVPVSSPAGVVHQFQLQTSPLVGRTPFPTAQTHFIPPIAYPTFWTHSMGP